MYRVLLVDDERAVCLGLQRLIPWNDYGFSVEATAANGQEAFDLQCRNHYDLIVTDLKMPVLDGIGLIEKLSQAKETCKIIIVSAYGEFSYAQTAMRYGVRYYLVKPINEQVIGGYLSKLAEDLGQDSHREEGYTKSDFEHQYRLSTNGVITEIKRYISVHYGEQLTLNLLAKIYNFSPIYLGRLFKKEVGISFNEYLNICRVNMAKHYMETSADMVYEIAEKCGYGDVNYFYKCFKSIVGITPGEYRSLNPDPASDTPRPPQ